MAKEKQVDEQHLFGKRAFVTPAALALTLAVFLSIAWKYIPAGQLNADEGFYCLAAKKAVHGQIPYRDFAYPQMPVLPYMNGLAMKIVGFGYLQQRAVNATWGILTLVVVFYLGCCIADRCAAFVAAWVTATSIFWMHFICMGKTYAAAGLFLILAALAMFVPRSYYKRITLFTLAAVLTVGCRLTTAPTLFILWVFLILQADTFKKRTIATVSPILASIALLLPFFLTDPENFIFWNLSYHLGTSLNLRGWFSIKQHLWLAPGVLLVIIAGLVGVAIRFRRFRLPELGIFLAAIIGVAVQLSLKSSYGEYSVPYVPLSAVSAAVIVSKFKWFNKLCLAIIVFSLLVWLGPRPVTQDYMPDALLDTAKFLRAQTSADDRILTCFPIVAVQAQREVFEGLEMGKLAVTSEIPEDEALRLHLVTPKTLIELVKTKEPAAVVLHSSISPWNFLRSVPSLRPNNIQQILLFLAMLNQHYHIAFKEHPFAVYLPNSPRGSQALKVSTPRREISSKAAFYTAFFLPSLHHRSLPLFVLYAKPETRS